MAGLFYVPGISSGITWFRSWESILASILEFLPAPAAARSFSAPFTRRSCRHKRLNSDDCTLHAGSGKSPLSSGCFAIRRGPCRCSACQRHNTASASATRKPLSNRELGISRVGIFTTVKMPKAVIICDLRVTLCQYVTAETLRQPSHAVINAKNPDIRYRYLDFLFICSADYSALPSEPRTSLILCS